MSCHVCYSIRKMSTGETKNRERRRYSVCHDILGVRKLRRGPQDIPRQVSRSKLTRVVLFAPLRKLFVENRRLNMTIDWHGKSQSQRNQSEGGSRGGGGYGGGGNAVGTAASSSSTYRGRSESANQTLTPPMEGDEHHQVGYNDVYGHVPGNGDVSY